MELFGLTIAVGITNGLLAWNIIILYSILREIKND